jgi:hypothetical protein
MLAGTFRAMTLLLARIVAWCLARLSWNAAYPVFERNGFHLLRDQYYAPIPAREDVDHGYWDTTSELPGVDLREAASLELLSTVFPRYVAEFRNRFPNEDPGDGSFYLLNGTYLAVDAHVYYALIRHSKASRVIEIGAGWSTHVAAAACLKNAEENGTAPRLVAIEPYPGSNLPRNLRGLTEIIQRKAQDVPLSFFQSLEAGDVLFVDSSHVLRSGNDVEYIYLEILPRLRPGVLVQIHDISLPRRYPRVYFDRQLFWNEQQLLQAFLAFNARFEVVWAGNAMMLKHPERMLEVFPEITAMRRKFPYYEPTAFWIRSREA